MVDRVCPSTGVRRVPSRAQSACPVRSRRNFTVSSGAGVGAGEIASRKTPRCRRRRRPPTGRPAGRLLTDEGLGGRDDGMFAVLRDPWPSAGVAASRSVVRAVVEVYRGFIDLPNEPRRVWGRCTPQYRARRRGHEFNGQGKRPVSRAWVPLAHMFAVLCNNRIRLGK